METAERIACLETKVNEIDRAIADIREEQEAARVRDTERQVSMGKLTVQLEGLIHALSEHNKSHDKNKAGTFTIAALVLTTCSLAVMIYSALGPV
jgi:chromosome segregation ATPase